VAADPVLRIEGLWRRGGPTPPSVSHPTETIMTRGGADLGWGSDGVAIARASWNGCPGQELPVVLCVRADDPAPGRTSRPRLTGPGRHDLGSRSSGGVVRGLRALMNTTSSRSARSPPARTHHWVPG
jgi:hypothetical protein